jgi:CDP-diacylglycerol--serine O-phosphatidyltransferase
LITRHIPNFVTILNLLSGSIAIVFAFDGNLQLASWFIAFAAVFDFLDGTLARLLNARSAVGLQLDSLADVISFGLAPAVIVYQMMLSSFNMPFLYFSGKNLVAFLAFLITAFSALRLAKFNVDDGQQDSFLGLPTPADALFFASLPFVLMYAEQNGAEKVVSMLENFWILAAATLVFSILMVSNIRLFSLKIKSLAFSKNQIRYIFAGLVVIMVILLKIYALPLAVILYILLSVVDNLRSAKSGNT